MKFDIIPESLKNLEVDCLQYWLGLVEFYQQYDEYSLVRQLLEFRVADLMVLEQNSSHGAKNLTSTDHS